MYVELSDNTHIRLEKNEVVRLTEKGKSSSESCRDISLNGQKKTLSDMFTNGEKMSPTNFWLYNAKTNNCQDFINTMLQANGFGNSKDYVWIKQDTRQIFDSLPGFTEKLANLTTDLAASTDIIVSGKGKFSNILISGKGKKK